MISRKQVRIHQKKEKNKKLKLRLRQLAYHLLKLTVSKFVFLILGHVLNFNYFLDLIKELILNISNSRYKLKGDYFINEF